MPKPHRAAVDLAPLLDGSSAGELIPELARYGLQQLIELEVSARVPSSGVNPQGLSPGVAGAERAHLRRLALQGVGRPVSLV